MIIPLLLATLLAVYTIYALCRPHLFSPYRGLPRPRQPPLLARLWHDPTSFELTQWMLTVPNDGFIRFFGLLNREVLMITTIEAHKELLLRDAQKYDKLNALAALQWPIGVSGLVSAKGALHKMHRRQTIGAYGPTWARTIHPTVWKSVRDGMTVLSQEEISGPGRVVKINRFMRGLCLDIIGQVAFSLDLGALADREGEISSRYLQALEFGEYMPLFFKLLQICPTQLQLIASTIVSKVILHIDVSDMLSLVRRTLAAKLSLVKEEHKRDHLGHDLTDMTIRRAYPLLSERALLRHAQTTLGGSVEMVSNELAWAVYALSLPAHQHIQEKLREEIRSHFVCEPETVTHNDLKPLVYLDAVVNEVLRMYPSVSHRWRVCNTSTNLLGRRIHKGTLIAFSPYSMNRHPAFWGPDADEFRPERWLAERDDPQQQHVNNDTRRDAYAFMTFGQGSRKCVGEYYARVVMACAIMGFIGRYRFTMPPDADVLEGEKVSFAIVMKAPIIARVEEVPGWVEKGRNATGH